MAETYLVTGASGHLGRRVVELLLEQGKGPIVATTRDPSKLADLAARGVTVRAADFEDEASLGKAFAGVTRALLVSTDALDRPGRRVEQHVRAIRALEAAGVKHVVYTSCTAPEELLASVAPDHAATEKALAATKLGYTFLRNNLYADLLFVALPGALASGQLVDAKGNGKIAWVTREDCARAAAGALVTASGREALDVSGPESLDSDQIAALASKLAGKPITHLSVTPEALVEGMVAHGLPKPLAEVFASFDAAAAKGQLDLVTDVVTRLAGRPPQSVASFLSDGRQALGL